MAAKDTTVTPEDPKLYDVLAPAFKDCEKGHVSDAMEQWGKISGKISMDWTEPDAAITVQPMHWSKVRNAAHGLQAIARLSRIIKEGQVSEPSGWLTGGLDSAMVALSDVIVAGLDEATHRASMRAEE